MTTQTSDADLARLTKKGLRALEAKAETAGDHQRLAAYYRLRAQHQMEESTKQAKLAEVLERNPLYSSNKFRLSTVEPRWYFAEKYLDSQKSNSLAARHEALAKAGDLARRGN